VDSGQRRGKRLAAFLALFTVHCLLSTLSGCAEPNTRRAPDPLIGNREPLPPAGGSILPAPQPVPAAGPPPVPVATGTLSPAALASGGTPKPLDGGHDLRIGDPAPAGVALNPPQPAPGALTSTQVRGVPTGFRVTTFEQGQSLLESRGVKWQRLEQEPGTGAWTLSCTMPNPRNPKLVRTFEAQAPSVLAAMQAVLDQIEREGTP
jgi:hypothetical protein